MSDRNAKRAMAIEVSRAFKELFWRARAPKRAVWRRLFLGEDDATLRRSGEAALADLRNFCFAHPNNRRLVFSSDALVTARRLGRREVFERITDYLNLDEAAVQQLMEIDDGIG